MWLPVRGETLSSSSAEEKRCSVVNLRVCHKVVQTLSGGCVQVFSLKSNRLSGGLPAGWGSSQGAFPNLTILALDDNRIGGFLPSEWSQGWPSLS